MAERRNLETSNVLLAQAVNSIADKKDELEIKFKLKDGNSNYQNFSLLYGIEQLASSKEVLINVFIYILVYTNSNFKKGGFD